MSKRLAGGNVAVLPGKVDRIHWTFDDPAVVVGSESRRLEAFRRIRDEIGR